MSPRWSPKHLTGASATTPDARAAKLAAGQWGVVTTAELHEPAGLSHYSAAALRELVRWDGRPFEITAPSKRSHPRINAHRSKNIEREVVKGIPILDLGPHPPAARSRIASATSSCA